MLTPPTPLPSHQRGSGSAVDGAPRPGFVFGPRFEMGDGHLHCLDLLEFRRDAANLVAHFIAFHRHILALDAEERETEGFKPRFYRHAELFSLPSVGSAVDGVKYSFVLTADSVTQLSLISTGSLGKRTSAEYFSSRDKRSLCLSCGHLTPFTQFVPHVLLS